MLFTLDPLPASSSLHEMMLEISTPFAVGLTLFTSSTAILEKAAQGIIVPLSLPISIILMRISSLFFKLLNASIKHCLINKSSFPEFLVSTAVKYLV